MELIAIASLVGYLWSCAKIGEEAQKPPEKPKPKSQEEKVGEAVLLLAHELRNKIVNTPADPPAKDDKKK